MEKKRASFLSINFQINLKPAVTFVYFCVQCAFEHQSVTSALRNEREECKWSLPFEIIYSVLKEVDDMHSNF